VEVGSEKGLCQVAQSNVYSASIGVLVHTLQNFRFQYVCKDGCQIDTINTDKTSEEICNTMSPPCTLPTTNSSKLNFMAFHVKYLSWLQACKGNIMLQSLIGPGTANPSKQWLSPLWLFQNGPFSSESNAH
jgi:hypothetical protein